MTNDNHSEMNEPYEDIVAAMAMLESAAQLLAGHPLASDLTDIRNALNDERLALLGNGKGRPFWVSEIVTKTQETPDDR